ncbi:glyoxylate/hydroxypyruvate reductase HPR3-like [Populus alba x Populus x berolinensis]|nr:glyoxylate/hydroxypyruvate reductase HPR3-like [Populus alba x Populus x berolinensis]
MDDQEEQQDNTSDQNHKPQDLPQVLLLKPPPVLSVIGEQPFLSKKYQFLKAWESPLPLLQFLTAHADSIQAILCSGAAPVTDDLLQLLPSVRLVVTASAGTNHIDLEACHRRGISVTNAGNVFSDDGADAAVGLLIDVLRKITASDRYVRQGLWVNKGDYPLGSKLRGKRVGIVGLGGIGLEIAKRLEAFGCNVLYNSRKKKAHLSYPFYSDVRQLAANSDALIICCALTDQTRHMIDKDVFSALGKEGVIVNIGRGAIVDEKEMVRCLVHGEIAGAGLDVFENEPDVPKELFELDNVVLSPHRAVFTPESFMALCELVRQTLPKTPFLDTMGLTTSFRLLLEHSVQAVLSHGICPVNTNIIRLLPSLSLIVTTSAGLNHIDLQECHVQGFQLGGKKVGIVGLGSIGQEAAKGLEHHGCNILYNSRTKKSSVPYPCYSNVCEVVANCEVLIICCELNDQTRHIISKEVFLALGKRGLIIDVGHEGLF